MQCKVGVTNFFPWVFRTVQETRGQQPITVGQIQPTKKSNLACHDVIWHGELVAWSFTTLSLTAEPSALPCLCLPSLWRGWGSMMRVKGSSWPFWGTGVEISGLRRVTKCDPCQQKVVNPWTKHMKVAFYFSWMVKQKTSRHTTSPSLKSVKH